MKEHLNRLIAELGLRQDAKFTASLEKQLEYVKTKTYDVVYPELKARTFIPVDNSADPGADTITYRQWDEFGMAQIISNFADDLPLIDALVEEFTQKVHSLGAAYQWSLQDIRRSAMSGAMLDTRKARAARRSIELRIEDIAATGHTNAGLTGIANNSNVTIVVPITGTWSTATGEQIIADMNKQVNTTVTQAKEAFTPDTYLLDIDNYTLISSKRISTTGDTHTTVLEAFLRSSPYITDVASWHKLALADAAGTGPRAICYKRDPEILTLEIPQEFESFPPQNKNLAFHVPCHARIGGVIMHYPIAVTYMDGI